jgi:hypothetical protein
MSLLETQFAILASDLRELIALLEEADERFWVPYLRRGLKQVVEHKLAGATFVLGCFGGEDTFSDLVIGRQWETTEPLRFHNLNARLDVLRTRVFDSANAITARRAW